MQLKNDFSNEVKAFFLDCWECWNCRCNGQEKGGLEIHHIKGRKEKESNSVLNAALLCNSCHSHCKHTDEERTFFLVKTVRFILKYFPHYKFTEKDLKFYAKNKKFYDLCSKTN
jgi:hypothetical protein